MGDLTLRLIRTLATAAALMLCAVTAHAQSASPADIVRAAAERNHVPVRIMNGVIMVESHFNCHAYNSHDPSYGIGQVQRRTARMVGVSGNLMDCEVGAEASARYLALALQRGGDGCAGVSLYNLGVFAHPRCTAYGRMVMRLARDVVSVPEHVLFGRHHHHHHHHEAAPAPEPPQHGAFHA